MISYTLYQKNPASHYIYIDLEIDLVTGDSLDLQLPAWRPGRYELGNFAKNIKRVDAFDGKGNPLSYTKLSKDCWRVETGGNEKIRITYSYYAAELNAGSCYADTEQLYVNPVHCCMYVVGRTEERHNIRLNVPETYKTACALKSESGILSAASFDELADSPLIASARLVSKQFEVEGITFHLHFQGQCKPEFKKIVADFTRFTKKQIAFWGDFPKKEYHYLFQITPYRFYHGVEHAASTVIALGPGYAINSGSTYEELLGVSSHELFHTWNVKAIRPAEMLPYDFTKENYACTGYVYEGFTTYYADKLLYTGGVFNASQYFSTLEERIQKHLHNFGRYNLSVAHSSWETWLDGYVPGAPYRKTSIYDEGCLVAFILDTAILKATGNKRSLRDVCTILYERFGKKKIGYGEQDVRMAVDEAAGSSLATFFDKYVYEAADLMPLVQESCSYLGWNLKTEASGAACEKNHGFKAADGPVTRVALVAPYSPAWKAGLFSGDEIIAVNNTAVRGNLNQWLGFFSGETVALTVLSGDQLRTITLPPLKKEQQWFGVPKLSIDKNATTGQREAFDAWRAY